MINYKYSIQEPAELQSEQSITGEYTSWIDVRDMGFVEASNAISNKIGHNADTDVVITAIDHGFVGIHHSGWGEMAKQYINAA